MTLEHTHRACMRFIVARALGATFTQQELEYQTQAWNQLSAKRKRLVFRKAQEFFTADA